MLNFLIKITEEHGAEKAFLKNKNFVFVTFRLPQVNRPFASSKKSHFQNEAKCEAIDMKMIFNYYANKTHFHNKGFALSLVLKVRFLELGNGLLNTFHSDFNCTTRKSTLSHITVFLLQVMRFAKLNKPPISIKPPGGLNRGFTVLSQ